MRTSSIPPTREYRIVVRGDVATASYALSEYVKTSTRPLRHVRSAGTNLIGATIWAEPDEIRAWQEGRTSDQAGALVWAREADLGRAPIRDR